LASGIGSLLLALFLHNAVRFLAVPLPFPLLCGATSAATLAFPLTLCVLIELLAGMMLASLSHDRLS
jgi:trimethylamine:corrinoid methyltransferase-like protein